MKVTVDWVGRIVIPKPVRDALGIEPDTQLEVVPEGTGLRLEPVWVPERVIEQHDGLPLLGPVPGTRLTDDDVRRLRDELQR